MQENQYIPVLPGCSLGELSNTPIEVETSRTERFKEMILEHIDSIYRFALYMTGNENDTQDLYQNIYVKACKGFDDLEDKTKFKAWLLKMSLDALIKFAPSYEISEKNLEDDVDRAMYSLSIKYRIFIILADIENFSYKEISYITSCPVGTVASKLYESRQIMHNNFWKRV